MVNGAVTFYVNLISEIFIVSLKKDCYVCKIFRQNFV